MSYLSLKLAHFVVKKMGGFVPSAEAVLCVVTFWNLSAHEYSRFNESHLN